MQKFPPSGVCCVYIGSEGDVLQHGHHQQQHLAAAHAGRVVDRRTVKHTELSLINIGINQYINYIRIMRNLLFGLIDAPCTQWVDRGGGGAVCATDRDAEWTRAYRVRICRGELVEDCERGS